MFHPYKLLINVKYLTYFIGILTNIRLIANIVKIITNSGIISVYNYI